MLKIISYNVHDWYTADGKHNLDQIVELYRELQPYILCMQLLDVSNRSGNGSHPRYITAQILTPDGIPFYVNCLHLDHRVEPNRMKELASIEGNLKPLFEKNAPQIWLGDYNSLTEEDYEKTEWEEIANVRKKNSWESPKTQVTSRMAELGFKDSWKLMKKPLPVSTCRFNTHIDYLFINEPFRKLFELKSILHHASQASDHAPVVGVFEQVTFS
ncbi:uncharacterized protein LOC111695785 isoform X2 [Eurytemora carolleeae]|uniref:uncharacterized protein LOC111695785 isoform X2 n=1 Tax=Eurytemora carolleeae TaxID=1294199 RepID=UPI000C770CD9|nr:uncharacterized protein LOC111695785 isoform X2 [Eurytemora carolleeae]|eukprot:XP_023320992.1 uncharacterized protein LOC111695785 isoform X2 [Eurytemora affinis]